MRKLLPALLLFFQWSCLSAQSEPEDSLLKKASTRLEKGNTTVSGILTDTEFLPLHPLSGFRELIRKYCDTGPLSICATEEPGRKIRVLGNLVDENGKPVAGALVYLYQTDARGWYSATNPHVGGNEGDMRHARLFGYVKTDLQGKFELHTVKPSGYPQSDLPAHIHIHVWAEGYASFVNELLFEDDERLVGDIREQSVRNRFLISQAGLVRKPFDQQFTYTIRLQKN